MTLRAERPTVPWNNSGTHAEQEPETISDAWIVEGF